MENTIKLLKFSLVMLYLSFVCVVLEMVGAIIAGIILKAQNDLSTFWSVFINLFIGFVVLAIIGQFIKLTDGSIKEHAQIIERVEALEKGATVSIAAPISEPVKSEKEKVDVTVALAKTSEKEITPEAPKHIEEQNKVTPIVEELAQTRIKPSDLLISNGKITIKGKTHDIKKVEELSAVGSELHFVIGKTKFIVEFDYFSEASKMYDTIDEQLS